MDQPLHLSPELGVRPEAWQRGQAFCEFCGPAAYQRGQQLPMMMFYRH